MVVDWRAPVSLPFYRATRREPMGVGAAAPLRLPARRRSRRSRTRTSAAGEPPTTSTPRILEAEIERPRVGPMRDIVATIQPEQDVIVRADVSRSIARAGRPGHRQDRGRAAPRGVPPLRPPRAAAPPGRAGRRSQRELPALHPRRAAGPRRGRGRADHDRGAGRQDLAALNPRWTIRGRRRRRASPRSRATRGWPRCSRAPCGRTSARPPRGSWCRAAPGGSGWRRTRPRRSSPTCAPAGCGTAPRAPCCPRRSPTGSW